jgi:hypothetical protein
MREDAPHIEVQHPLTRGAAEIANTYNVDTGPLAMPSHIKIGAQGVKCGGDHDWIIRTYDEQVDEYDIWLSHQIKAKNPEVLAALEEIYAKSLGCGVILQTSSTPQPNITHAHVIKRTILSLL